MRPDLFGLAGGTGLTFEILDSSGVWRAIPNTLPLPTGSSGAPFTLAWSALGGMSTSRVELRRDATYGSPAVGELLPARTVTLLRVTRF